MKISKQEKRGEFSEMEPFSSLDSLSSSAAVWVMQLKAVNLMPAVAFPY